MTDDAATHQLGADLAIGLMLRMVFELLSRQQKDIQRLQRSGISTAAAELLLARMRATVDDLCARRARIEREGDRAAYSVNAAKTNAQINAATAIEMTASKNLAMPDNAGIAIWFGLGGI
jgi:hypothetical protein